MQRKLRVSLVDRCNLSCFFCHNEGQGPISRGKVTALDPETLTRLVRVAARHGTRSVKLTGGEPLLYRSPDGRSTIVDLVERLNSVRRDNTFDLSMTTNGTLLPRLAEPLAEAGLDRITVSLSTMTQNTFERFIAPDATLLRRITSSIDSARDADLRPLKLNIPVFHSEQANIGNLNEIDHLISFARAHRVDEVRFFTLIAHDDFPEFEEYYHFFSQTMRAALIACFSRNGCPSPEATVDILARIGGQFASQLYPKVEFGVHLDGLKISFEALKHGRFPNSLKDHQEGPYAIRISADGGIRSMLRDKADNSLMDAIRAHASDEFLGTLYHAAQEEIP